MRMKQSAGSMLFDAFNTICLVLLAVVCLYPFWYLLVYSLSDPGAASVGGVSFLPRGFTLENYGKIFALNNIASSAAVSLARTVVGTLLTVTACSFFAYLVTKPMYLRRLFYRLLVITMYVDAGLVPTFLVIRQYGLINNFLVYLLPTLMSAYYVVLIKTFIEQLPPALEESAVLDGAGTFTTFTRIILPLSKPILATIVVFAAVGQWNSWLDAHLYVNDRGLWPMQYILYRYLTEAASLIRRAELSPSSEMTQVQITPTAVRMTMTAVVTIPILCIYPFMQRHFVKGIMIGAVKG